jgi:hypothetical protein
MTTAPDNSRRRLIPITLAQVLGLACGIAGVKLNSRFVPPAQLGSYGLFLTFAPIGMWVVHAGLVKFTGRHWAGSPQRAGLWREIVASWARRLPWLALAAIGATLALGGRTPGLNWALGPALFIAAALLALGTLMQAALQAERAHWADCAVAVSGSVTRTFFPPLLFIGTAGTIAVLWLGFCLHTLVFAATGAWMLRRYWRAAPAAAPAAPQLTAVYQGPLFIALALAGWVLSGLNRWLVAWRFGEIEAGYFTLAGAAAAIAPTVLGAVVLQYSQPVFFALGDATPADPRRLARRVDQAALAFAALALLAVGGVAFIAPWLVGPLINPAYRDSLHWIVPAGCFATATMTAVFYHTLLLAGHRERACGPVDLTTAGVLAAGCVVTALAGQTALSRWMMFTPLVPWLLTRPLARFYLFKPAATPAPAPGPGETSG